VTLDLHLSRGQQRSEHGGQCAGPIAPRYLLCQVHPFSINESARCSLPAVGKGLTLLCECTLPASGTTGVLILRGPADLPLFNGRIDLDSPIPCTPSEVGRHTS